MIYLKLFESKVLLDSLKELREKTDVVDIKSDIDDSFLVLTDEFSSDIITSKTLTINVKYKRRNIRKASLSYTYYEDLEKSINVRKAYVTDTNTLEDFLNKCEHATSMDFNYRIGVRMTINSVEELDKAREAFLDIKGRLESMGYNFLIDNSSGEHNRMVNFNGLNMNDYIELLFKKDDFIHIEGDDDTYSLYATWITITGDVDLEKLKAKDLSIEVPSNIVSDFEEFSNRFRMSSKDKLELINIFKKADWNNNSI